MPKVKVVKTTVKKKGTKRSGTVGGSSTRNFSTKYRNVDYKYRLVDVDDTFSDASLQRILSVYSNNSDLITYGTDGQQAFAQGLRNSCYFIPLSTSGLVSRSMNVNIKCKYPFAYCIFQNTPDFYKYIFKYVKTSNKTINSRSFGYYFVGNAAQSPDSILFMPCQRTNSEDQGYLSNSQWSEGISVLFSQLCQKQSTYKEVYSATNSGLYTANVSVYYKKASQFLSGSFSNYVYSGYSKVQKTATTLDEMYSFTSKFNDIGTWQTVFRPGDMTLCVLPIYYFYNKMLDSSKLPSSDLVIYPFSFDIKRRVYRLNQDNGLSEAAERILNDKVTTVTQTINKVAQVPTTANQGNNFNFNVNLRDFVQRCTQGLLGRPKILREDLDNAGQNCNCVVVDENCYDPQTETLQMQAYMDLQAVPTAAGTSVLNNFEDEDTFNCNVITQAANVDFEQANQIVQLPNIVQGSLTATSETIQQTNTGPTLVQIVQQPYVLDAYDPDNNFDTNIMYNRGYTRYIGACIAGSTPLVLGQAGSGGVAAVSFISDLAPITGGIDFLESFKLQFEGFKDKIHLRLTIYKADSVNIHLDSSAPSGISVALSFSMTPAYLGDTNYVNTIGYSPVNEDGKRAVIDIRLFYGLGNITINGVERTVLAIGPGSLMCDNLSYPNIAQQHIEMPSTVYYSFISLLTTPMALVQQLSDGNVKYLTLNDFLMTTDDGRAYPYDDFLDALVYDTPTSFADITSPNLLSNYLYDWVNIYHKIFVSSKEGWKRFKGFLGKCWKWIKNAIPIGKKIINSVAPFVPAPYSTAVVAVADKVDNIVTNLDTIAVKKTKSTFSAAVLDDDEDDVFEITPQYRLSTSSEPADIGSTGNDWIDGESYEQSCNAYGVQTLRTYRFDFTQHPVYGEYFKNRRLGLTLGDDSTIYCQQRIKVNFRKRCSQAIASAYKAVLTLGSDTNYLTPDDYQEQQ